MSSNEPIIEHRKVKTGSERSFGLVFAAFFALVGFWPLMRGSGPRWWAVALALAFLAAAFVAPKLLAPLNRLWFRFGLLLHHIINPIIMAMLFAVAIVPMGLLVRLLGKDLLRLKRDPKAETYWIARDPPGPATGSMSKQF